MKKGFTLIELLVVIAIIGILSAIGLVSLNGAREKARDAQAKSDLGQMRTALVLYADDNGTKYPGQVGVAIATCANADMGYASATAGTNTGVWASGGPIIGTTGKYLSQLLKSPSATAGQEYFYCTGVQSATSDAVASDYALFYKLEGAGTYYYSIMMNGTVSDVAAKKTAKPTCAITTPFACAP